MKFMIPLLMAVLSAASVAQSQSGTPSGVPNIAIPKTTALLVIETPKKGVTPQQIMDVIPSEIRATVNLYLDGKIREWYSRGDGKGVVFLVDATTEDEARAIMETLPLAKEQLISRVHSRRTLDADEGTHRSRDAAGTLVSMALPTESQTV